MKSRHKRACVFGPCKLNYATILEKKIGSSFPISLQNETSFQNGLFLDFQVNGKTVKKTFRSVTEPRIINLHVQLRAEWVSFLLLGVILYINHSSIQLVVIRGPAYMGGSHAWPSVLTYRVISRFLKQTLYCHEVSDPLSRREEKFFLLAPSTTNMHRINVLFLFFPLLRNLRGFPLLPFFSHTAGIRSVASRRLWDMTSWFRVK